MLPSEISDAFWLDQHNPSIFLKTSSNFLVVDTINLNKEVAEQFDQTAKKTGGLRFALSLVMEKALTVNEYGLLVRHNFHKLYWSILHKFFEV